MQTATTKQANTSRGDIEYIDVGEGIPTLYFHGTGAASDAALLLEQPLLRAGCRLIIPNRPGYYGTTLGPRGSADFCAELAAELLNHLSIERAAVIGTSGGGMPAAAFASIFPKRTAAVILQCAQSHAWTSGKWLPDRLARALFLFRYSLFRPLLRWQNMRHARRGHQNPIWCLQQMAGDRSAEIIDSTDVTTQITALTEMTVRCAGRPDGIQNDWAMLVGENGVAMGSIHCPTMIIHDRVDPLVPFCHAEWSHSCISGSTLLPIHAGGHLIWFGKDSDLMHNQRVAFLRESLDNNAI